MIYQEGHPYVPLADWQEFRKGFSPYLIDEVIDRSEIQLPDWFVPLARGVAIAGNHLLSRAHYYPGSYRPRGWQKTHCDVFIKQAVRSKDMVFATLIVRQYRNQRWWTIERLHPDRRYQDVSDVLVFNFGSTPIFCWNYQSAMRLAEYCHVDGPPSGLRWVVACPDNKDGAIKLARDRLKAEALGESHQTTGSQPALTISKFAKTSGCQTPNYPVLALNISRWPISQSPRPTT
jgi:hypothetical protein